MNFELLLSEGTSKIERFLSFMFSIVEMMCPRHDTRDPFLGLILRYCQQMYIWFSSDIVEIQTDIAPLSLCLCIVELQSFNTSVHDHVLNINLCV